MVTYPKKFERLLIVLKELQNELEPFSSANLVIIEAGKHQEWRIYAILFLAFFLYNNSDKIEHL